VTAAFVTVAVVGVMLKQSLKNLPKEAAI
jgi:hypothetical protein